MSGSKLTYVTRGFLCRCPNCGEGSLFARYLKQVSHCPTCGEAFGHIRADDFPPYLTILAVGHLVVPFILLVEQQGVSTVVQVALWLPITLLLTLVLLPRFKGAVLGLMWSMGMTGQERQ